MSNLLNKPLTNRRLFCPLNNCIYVFFNLAFQKAKHVGGGGESPAHVRDCLTQGMKVSKLAFSQDVVKQCV